MKLPRLDGPRVVIIVAALFITAAVVLLVVDPDTAPRDQPRAAVSQLRPPADHFGAGSYEVLADVMAGVYRTEGSTVTDWPMCHWKLWAGGHLVASGVSTGPATIGVEPMLDRVETEYCRTWRRQG